MDDLDRRVRASRPSTAIADPHAVDEDLLARLRAQPIRPRRSAPRRVAVPAAAGVTLLVTAALMLAGGPGDVGGPSSAAAISQALRWLDPPSGTILHARSVESSGEETITRESWQSADDPLAGRVLTVGPRTFEAAGDAFYDPATDTIYDPPTRTDAKSAKRRAAPQAAVGIGRERRLPAGDPIVTKVRILLEERRMVVTGPESHNGTEAWRISLSPDAERPVWTLWVSADDGKPLELRDPGRDPSEGAQVIRWTTYEVLSSADADQLLTLRGAHPSARVVRDPERVAAAERRLLPFKG